MRSTRESTEEQPLCHAESTLVDILFPPMDKSLRIT